MEILVSMVKGFGALQAADQAPPLSSSSTKDNGAAVIISVPRKLIAKSGC
jgi:hypothetical protein